MTLSDKIRQLCRRMYADQFTGKAPELLELADLAEALERDAEGLRRKYEKAHVGELQSLTCIFRSWVADELHVYDCDEDRAYAQHLLDRIDAALAKEQP